MKVLFFKEKLYYLGHIGSLDVPSYLQLDMRLGKRLARSQDVSIGIKNLLDDYHFEFTTNSSTSTTILYQLVIKI